MILQALFINGGPERVKTCKAGERVWRELWPLILGMSSSWLAHIGRITQISGAVGLIQTRRKKKATRQAILLHAAKLGSYSWQIRNITRRRVSW